MTHPLLPLPDRTVEGDAVYAVLGRALAYATEFEENCRALAHFYRVTTTEKDYAYEIYLLSKKGTLNGVIKSFISEHNLPNWVSDKIHIARKARNLICHDISHDHIERIASVKGRKSLQTDILLASQDIVDGNQLVMDINRLLMEDKSGPCSENFSYYAAVSEWILP